MRLHFHSSHSTTNRGACVVHDGARGRRVRQRAIRIAALAVALALSLPIGAHANAQTGLAIQAVSAVGEPIAYDLRPDVSAVRFTIGSARGWHWRMRFMRTTARLERGRETRDLGRVAVNIDARSVESNTPFAAAFVKSSAVLDTARYPSIRFMSTGFIPASDGSGKLLGLLTIRSVTQPIELEVTFDDPVVRAGARDTIAFTASGTFSRSAFGLGKWATSIDDHVQLQIEGEFARTSRP